MEGVRFAVNIVPKTFIFNYSFFFLFLKNEIADTKSINMTTPFYTLTTDETKYRAKLFVNILKSILCGCRQNCIIFFGQYFRMLRGGGNPDILSANYMGSLYFKLRKLSRSKPYVVIN